MVVVVVGCIESIKLTEELLEWSSIARVQWESEGQMVLLI